MTQKAKPILDDSTGSWSPTPLSAHLNEAIGDLNGVTSATDPVGDTFVVKLKGLAKPGPGPQVLTVCLQKSGTAIGKATVVLLQGSTPIAATTDTFSGSGDNVVMTLTTAQIAQITDYTDLHVSVTAGVIPVGCCSDPQPVALHATVASSCGCLNRTFVLTHQPGSNPPEWASVMYTECARGSNQIYLKCNGTQWEFSQPTELCYAWAPDIHPQSGWTCSPLNLVFGPYQALDYNCPQCQSSDTVTITITE